MRLVKRCEIIYNNGLEIHTIVSDEMFSDEGFEAKERRVCLIFITKRLRDVLRLY